MRTTKATTRDAFIVLLLASGTLAACSSSSTSPAGPGPTNSSAPISAVSPAASDSPSGTTTEYTLTTGEGTATDSQGDAATIVVTVGRPTPQLSLNQAELTGCSSEDSGIISSSPQQNMAIPLYVRVTVTSSIATDVQLVIDGSNVVTPGGNVNENPNALTDTWVTYASDSACDADLSGSTDGTLEWDNLAPGQTVTWSGWELDPGVITPDDTNGSVASQVIFALPLVGFGSNGGVFTLDAANSQNIVTCSGQEGPAPGLPVDASVALSNGCTAYSGS